VEKELLNHKPEFTEQQNLKINVVTWNCGGNKPQDP
jgi:hypothetical protein